MKGKVNMFIVYSRTDKLPAYEGCIVVNESDLVAAIYTKAYGPASKGDCESWVSKNCGPITK
jgi:hypothetical protein